MIKTGCDIMLISRFRNIAAAKDGRLFLDKVFTLEEIALSNESPDPIRWLALRFAGKEAVFKALDIQATEVELNNIQITQNHYFRPTVQLSGSLKDKTAYIDVSLSYDGDYVMATAIAEVN